MTRVTQLLAATALSCAITHVYADVGAAPQSKHQMMKDCMAKEAASDAGLTKEQMKKTCREVTKTEEENVQTEKAAEEKPAPTQDSSGG